MYEGFWCGGVGGARGLIKLMLGFTRVGRSGEVEGQWHRTYRTLTKFYSFFFGNLSLVNSDGGGGQGSGKSAGCGHDHNIHISVGFWGQTEDRLDQ